MSVTALFRHLRGSTPSNRAGRAGLPQPHRKSAGHRPLFVLRLEVLEGRLAPAVLIVNTLADEMTPDNFLSLREAIGVVDAGSTAGLSSAEQAQISGTLGQNDTIQFAPSLAGGTITLTSGQLAITRNLNLVGLGARQLTISGNAASRVFDVSGGASVSIAGLTIADGLAGIYDNGGGGIINESGSTLDLSGCIFTGNQSLSIIGGAIWNEFGATASVSNCIFTANTVVGETFLPSASECEGGAIDNDGTMTVVNSTFSGNQAIAVSAPFTDANGGAIADDGTLTVTDSTFTDNQAVCGNSEESVADGGAIAVFGSLTVTGSTLMGNRAIAGSGATFSSLGLGGGIEVISFSGFFATLTMTNSTLSGNLAQGGAGGSGAPGGVGAGGAIDILDSTVTITHTVISHNQAIGGAGGAGAAGGDGIGAGIDVGSGVLGGVFGVSPDNSSLTLSGSTLDHNQAIGGAGATGGAGWGGGLVVLAGTASDSGSTFVKNQALGGSGGLGGNGGNGLGGGIYVASAATASLTSSAVTGNHANGGSGTGASDGEGIGGGVYNLGTFYLDAVSVILGNHASTSNDNVFGPITPI